jgi:exoribonuclease R
MQADSVKGKRIQVSYDSWPSRSTYPLCHFLRVIGDIGDSRAEGDVILL